MSRSMLVCCVLLGAAFARADEPLPLPDPILPAPRPLPSSPRPWRPQPLLPPALAFEDPSVPRELIAPASASPVPLPELLETIPTRVAQAEVLPVAASPAARVRISDQPRLTEPRDAFLPVPVPDRIPVLVRPAGFDLAYDVEDACPAIVPADESVVGTEGEAARVEHLLEAARHLDAAGRPDQAVVLRHEANVSQRLHAKQRQLRALEREVAELRRLARDHFGEARQVHVKMTMFEIGRREGDSSKGHPLLSLFDCRSTPKAAIEPASHDASEPEAGCAVGGFRPAGWIEAEGPLLENLVEMLKHGTGDRMKVLSRPQLITLDGREAQLQIGGQFPIPVPQPSGEIETEFRDFGTQATVTPRIETDGSIRLAVSVEISERDFSQAVQVAGIEVPGLRVRRFHTEARVDSGNAILAWGPSSDEGTPFFLLYPEVVEDEKAVSRAESREGDFPPYYPTARKPDMSSQRTWISGEPQPKSVGSLQPVHPNTGELQR